MHTGYVVEYEYQIMWCRGYSAVVPYFPVSKIVKSPSPALKQNRMPSPGIASDPAMDGWMSFRDFSGETGSVITLRSVTEKGKEVHIKCVQATANTSSARLSRYGSIFVGNEQH